MQRKRRDDATIYSKPAGESEESASPTVTGRYPVKPKKSSRKKSSQSAGRAIVRGLKLTLLLLLIGLLTLAAFTLYFSPNLPSIAQLEVYEPKLSTKVLSADGKVIKEFYRERRTRVPLYEIPQYVVQALLATEDHRFYEHWGVDMIRFVKSAMVNVATMSASQGFSSLTQQLSRNLYFETEKSEKTLSRKFKEILTAIQIERTYSKREILEMYLTHMYFGNDAYGIQAAAKNFFGKDAADLSLVESAYLIGHLQAPSYYARNLEAADRRKVIVLKRMLDVGYITKAQYDEAKDEKVVLGGSRFEEASGEAPYFTEYVRQQLEVLSDSLHFNIYEDGLRVFTTLDSRAQAAAEAAYDQSVKEKFKGLDRFGAGVLASEARLHLPRYLRQDGYTEESIASLLTSKSAVDSLCSLYGAVQASFLALDPTNGHILAMIGGRDFSKYKLNHVTQITRQPGSTFKPFLYTAAIDNGYSPTFKLLNQDVVLIMDDGKRWTPQNYDGSRGGPTSLREALAKSLNLPAVRLMQEVVPPATVVSYAHKMGIETPLQPVDALALGVSDVVPIQIISAYGVFANKGIHVEPVAITKIEDREGTILYQSVPRYKEALSAETAFIMADMLKSGYEWGTGATARKFGFTKIAASKTGTTQKWSDAWYIGFTPYIVAGVWIGYDAYEVTLGNKNPGAVICSPIWGRFMTAVYDSLLLPDQDFEMPAGVVRLEVCKDSGMLALTTCPNKIKEVFNAKYQPTETCPLHVPSSKGKKRGIGY